MNRFIPYSRHISLLCAVGCAPREYAIRDTRVRASVSDYCRSVFRRRFGGLVVDLAEVWRDSCFSAKVTAAAAARFGLFVFKFLFLDLLRVVWSDVVYAQSALRILR